MRYYQANDTFVGTLENGGDRLVTKGEPLPETHELVRRDLAALEADPSRTALFRLLTSDEPVTAPKSRAKPLMSRAEKAEK